jgi:hypothetical protein
MYLIGAYKYDGHDAFEVGQSITNAVVGDVWLLSFLDRSRRCNIAKAIGGRSDLSRRPFEIGSSTMFLERNQLQGIA